MAPSYPLHELKRSRAYRVLLVIVAKFPVRGGGNDMVLVPRGGEEGVEVDHGALQPEANGCRIHGLHGIDYIDQVGPLPRRVFQQPVEVPLDRFGVGRGAVVELDPRVKVKDPSAPSLRHLPPIGQVGNRVQVLVQFDQGAMDVAQEEARELVDGGTGIQMGVVDPEGYRQRPASLGFLCLSRPGSEEHE